MGSFFLQTKDNKVRTIWILLLLPVLLFSLIFIIDAIQSLIVGISYSVQGESFSTGWENAQNLRSESMEWRTLNLTLIAFCYIFVAWFLKKIIDKSSFNFKEMGFKWGKNSFILLIGGFVVLSCLIILSQAIALIRGAVEIDFSNAVINLSGSALYGFFIYFVYEIMNAFSQEILFRGYLQTRIVKAFGPLIGIAFTSTFFMALHLFVKSFTVTEFIASVLIFCFGGLIYHLTNSLYFVGTLHMSISFMLRLFGILKYKNSNIDIAVVFILAILITIIVVRKRKGNPGLPQMNKLNSTTYNE